MVSQEKNELSIEVIRDDNKWDFYSNLESAQEQAEGLCNCLSLSTNKQDDEKQRRKKEKLMKANLLYFITVKMKADIFLSSEVGWVTKDKLILTLNDMYYLLNLDLDTRIIKVVKQSIQYGTQLVNMELFVSIVQPFNKFVKL